MAVGHKQTWTATVLLELQIKAMLVATLKSSQQAVAVVRGKLEQTALRQTVLLVRLVMAEMAWQLQLLVRL